MGVGGFFKGLGKGLLKSIPVIGEVASGIGSGRAEGRQAEANAQNQHDYLGLQSARLNLDAPRMRLGNSIQGDIAANAQDAHVTGPITHTHGQIPTITGGLRPSLMSGNTRQLGGRVSRDALLSQMQGPAFTPTPLPKANWFDKVIGGLGYAGLAGKGMQQFQKPNRTPPFIGTPGDDDYDWEQYGVG